MPKMVAGIERAATRPTEKWAVFTERPAEITSQPRF